MGTYWVIASHTKSEYVDPFDVGSGPKWYGCIMGDFSKLVCYLMLERWRGDYVEFHTDNSDPYTGETSYSLFKNITHEVARMFNKEVEPLFKVPDKAVGE